MALKKIPMRKCLGCGEMFPQKELVRIVKSKIKTEGEEESYELSLDLIGKKSGRGAYICKKSECFEIALKKKRFNKALGCEIPAELTESIRQELKENE